MKNYPPGYGLSFYSSGCVFRRADILDFVAVAVLEDDILAVSWGGGGRGE